MYETEKSAISRSESHQHQWGYARNVLEFVRNAEFAPLCIERNLGVNGAARSELTQLSLVKFVIGGARVELKRKPIQKVPLYAASSKLAASSQRLDLGSPRTKVCFCDGRSIHGSYGDAEL